MFGGLEQLAVGRYLKKTCVDVWRFGAASSWKIFFKKTYVDVWRFWSSSQFEDILKNPMQMIGGLE